MPYLLSSSIFEPVCIVEEIKQVDSGNESVAFHATLSISMNKFKETIEGFRTYLLFQTKKKAVYNRMDQ